MCKSPYFSNRILYEPHGKTKGKTKRPFLQNKGGRYFTSQFVNIIIVVFDIAILNFFKSILRVFLRHEIQALQPGVEIPSAEGKTVFYDCLVIYMF